MPTVKTAISMPKSLFDQVDDPLAIQLRDAVRLRVRHLLQEYQRIGLFGDELIDESRDPVPKEVVAEVHHEWAVPEKLLGRQHGMSQAERGGLAQVGH